MNRSIATLTAFVLAVGTGLLASSFALAADVVTSSATIPFQGSFFADEYGSSQMVDLAGAVHVVTQVTFTPLATKLSIHADLPTAFGTGRDTGCKYMLYGADRFHQTFAAGPISSATAIGGFSIPPNPVKPSVLCQTAIGATVFLQLNLRFSTDGRVLGGLLDVDGGSTVDVCGEEACSD